MQWGVIADANCVICKNRIEIREHIFFECPISKRAWRIIMGWIKFYSILRLCLVCACCVHIWAQNAFKPFFFFFWLSAVNADFFNREQCIRALFMDPQISIFINFFIKNGSHDTIHTFKNYFITVFFSFQFSAVSERTLNRASYCSWRIFFLLAYSILLCHFFCSLLCVIVCVCGFFFLRCWLFQLCFCSVFIMN